MTITLNEDKARTWLRDELADDIGITDTWEPRDVGEESVIYELLNRAQANPDVIAKPNTIEQLAYVYDADSDGGGYVYTVDVLIPGEPNFNTLRLSTMWAEMRKIGEPELTGVEVALSVLREAVDAINSELRKLALYVERQPAEDYVPREPKVYDHRPRPDDDPKPGDRCKDCGDDITWEGPTAYDWLHVDEQV